MTVRLLIISTLILAGCDGRRTMEHYSDGHSYCLTDNTSNQDMLVRHYIGQLYQIEPVYKNSNTQCSVAKGK